MYGLPVPTYKLRVKRTKHYIESLVSTAQVNFLPNLTAQTRAIQWHSERLRKRLATRAGSDSESRRRRAGHAFQNRGQYCAKTHETKLVLTAKIRALQWHSEGLKKRLSARAGIATNDSELRRQRAGHAFQNANGGSAVVKMWIALVHDIVRGRYAVKQATTCQILHRTNGENHSKSSRTGAREHAAWPGPIRPESVPHMTPEPYFTAMLFKLRGWAWAVLGFQFLATLTTPAAALTNSAQHSSPRQTLPALLQQGSIWVPPVLPSNLAAVVTVMVQAFQPGQSVAYYKNYTSAFSQFARDSHLLFEYTVMETTKVTTLLEMSTASMRTGPRRYTFGALPAGPSVCSTSSSTFKPLRSSTAASFVGPRRKISEKSSSSLRLQSLTPGKAQLSREEHNKWMARAVARDQEEQRRLGKTDQLNMRSVISVKCSIGRWKTVMCRLSVLFGFYLTNCIVVNGLKTRAREAGVSGSAIITFVNEVDNEAVPPEVDVLFTYLERNYIYYASVISESLLWLDVDAMVEQDAHGLFKFNMYSKIIECNEALGPREYNNPPIEIFKTESRGWGVRTSVTLIWEQVLGLYTGRRQKASKLFGDRASYIFQLDIDEDPGDNPDDGYSVDTLHCETQAIGLGSSS
ncbi:hypothetical protein B0H13DRAFT_1853352 [Mycena leptocephala]|nr:hypothetical protein B0H13DRAFT_1853352 [Mycena leptocephala]